MYNQLTAQKVERRRGKGCTWSVNRALGSDLFAAFSSDRAGIKKNLIWRILLLDRPIHYIEAVITISGHLVQCL